MQPKISIVVPIHDMKNGEFFLWRLVNSLTSQTFKDWELIITKDGRMAENTNSGIRRAHGEYIKILYLDDYLTDENVLQKIVDNLDCEWVIVGASDNPQPIHSPDLLYGVNRYGSPSALVMRNHAPGEIYDNMLFDESMSWLLDCDFYYRMVQRYGFPKILDGNYVTLGKGDHQMTHILTNEEKLSEHELIKQKYAK